MAAKYCKFFAPLQGNGCSTLTNTAGQVSFGVLIDLCSGYLHTEGFFSSIINNSVTIISVKVSAKHQCWVTDTKPLTVQVWKSVIYSANIGYPLSQSIVSQ